MKYDKYEYIQAEDLKGEIGSLNEAAGIVIVRQLIRETGGGYYLRVPKFNSIAGAVKRLILDAKKEGLTVYQIHKKYEISIPKIYKVLQNEKRIDIATNDC